MKELWDLFFTFTKIGSVTFGGGYAMLFILQKEICDKHHWMTNDEILDCYAIGQCTPGIIAVNTATFVGNKVKGVLGGVVATFGMVFPSMVIITIIAAFIQNFAELAMVKNAFAGIRAAVCVLILSAIVKLWKTAVTDKVTLAIFAVVFALAIFTNLSPALFVILAGVAGIFLRGKKAVSK